MMNILRAILLIVASTPTTAQVWLGLQGGFSIASQDVSTKNVRSASDISSMMNMTGGIMGSFAITDKVGIQTELNYLRKGCHSTTRLGSFVRHTDEIFNYVEVPVMLYYTLPSFIPMLDVKVIAGPSFSVLESIRRKGYILSSGIGGTTRYDVDEVLLKADAQSTDMSISAGLGANFNCSSTVCIMLSGRYLFGISNIVPDNSSSLILTNYERVQNRTLIVMAGIALRIE